MIQRYSLYIGHALPPEGTVGELYTVISTKTEHGEWVRYEDVRELIERAQYGEREG